MERKLILFRPPKNGDLYVEVSFKADDGAAWTEPWLRNSFTNTGYGDLLGNTTFLDLIEASLYGYYEIYGDTSFYMRNVNIFNQGIIHMSSGFISQRLVREIESGIFDIKIKKHGESIYIILPERSKIADFRKNYQEHYMICIPSENYSRETVDYIKSQVSIYFPKIKVEKILCEVKIALETIVMLEETAPGHLMYNAEYSLINHDVTYKEVKKAFNTPVTIEMPAIIFGGDHDFEEF